jgi:hypothetical protein
MTAGRAADDQGGLDDMIGREIAAEIDLRDSHAVDAAAGFSTWDRRSVLLKLLK